MWSVATALAFASAVHVSTDWLERVELRAIMDISACDLTKRPASTGPNAPVFDAPGTSSGYWLSAHPGNGLVHDPQQSSAQRAVGSGDRRGSDKRA
jgi:hypothetical protein